MINKPAKIFYENIEDAIERNREKIHEVHKYLRDAGVKYVMSSWIDLHGIPKTKPVPISDFENLCLGKGPQFAVHSVSFVPELTPADSDQIMIPDLDSVYICPWDKSTALRRPCRTGPAVPRWKERARLRRPKRQRNCVPAPVCAPG